MILSFLGRKKSYIHRRSIYMHTYAAQYADKQLHTLDNLWIKRLTKQNHSKYSQSDQALAEGSRHCKTMDKYIQKLKILEKDKA